MSKSLTVSFSLLLVLLSSTALAQPDVARVCNAVFSHGIRDNYELLSEREQFQTFQDRLCQAKFESYQQFKEGGSAFGIDIPLAEGILGIGGSSNEKAGQ